MKVYTVLQCRYYVGDDGLVETTYPLFHGVFSTREKAEQYVSAQKVETVEGDLNSADETLHIIESNLDDSKIIPNWMF